MNSRTKKPRSIKLRTDLNSAVNYVIQTNGQSFNSFVNQAIEEKIDDNLDFQILNKAIENNKNDKLYSTSQVEQELGL